MSSAKAARLTALICLLALFLVGADTYHVSGIVIDSESRAPIGGSRVMLFQGTNSGPAVVTGSDGTFAFDVPKGQYRMTLQIQDLFQNFGEVVPGTGLGSAVITGPGLDTSDLEFVWHGPSSLSGRVLDEAGDPVETALVQLLQATVVRGKKVVRSLRFVWTNDLGQYRFGPINGGTYYLSVSAKPWYSQSVYGQSGADGSSGSSESLTFAPVYFPGVQDAKQASLIVVAPGKDVSADFSLSVVPAVNLRITCDGPPTLSKTVDLFFEEGLVGADRVQQVLTMFGNQLDVAGVPPGRYIVQALGRDGQSVLIARQSISVGAADMAIDLKLRSPASVSGTVRMKDPTDRPPPRFLVRLTNAEDGSAINAAIQPDGSFQFGPVSGKRWIPSVVSSAGHFASEITLKGAELRDGAFEPSSDEPVVLTIVASDETGHLSGHVVQDGHPVRAAMVALVPRRENSLPDESYLYQTESDGSFDWTYVRAGDYYLFATTEAPLEYANPAVLRGYIPGAVQIHIDAHSSYTERVSLSARAPL